MYDPRDPLSDEPVPAHIDELDDRDDPTAVELRWLVLKLLGEVGGDPRYATELDVRYVILAVERWTQEREQSEQLHHLCRGLYLMAHELYRAALTEFENALDGHADGDLGPLSQLALEAHAFSLLRLGCERDALTEFERLLRQEVAEEQAPDTANHTAELLGVVRLARTPPDER